MKFTTARWMAALALSGLVAGDVLAQEETKPAAPGTAPQRPAVAPGAKIAARGDQLANMTEVLKLSEEQRAKIKPILEEQTKQINAIRADKSIPLEERTAKYQQMRKANHEKIRAAFNPEQAAKWDKMRGVGVKPPAPINPPGQEKK